MAVMASVTSTKPDNDNGSAQATPLKPSTRLRPPLT